VRKRRGVKRVALILACAVAAAALVAPRDVNAEASIRVQQSDGTVQNYAHVHATLSGTTLWLRSPDRKDRLQIVSQACSFPRNLERCLPDQVFLHKPDKTHQIEITHGVFYVNLTNEPHQLLHSSQMLPPHGVMVFLHTIRGTYVSATGSLDAVK
jgi:hypothetical protein